MSESAIPDLEQKDYTKPEMAKEVSKQMIGLIDGKYPVDVAGLGKVLVKKPTYKEHADVEAFKATETVRVMREFPNVLSERKLRMLLEKNGLWTSEDDLELESVSKQLEAEEETLRDLISPTKDRDTEEVQAQDKLVVSLRNKRSELLTEKNKLFSSSLDMIVNSIAHMYMTWRCSFGEDGKPKFPSLNEMLGVSQEQLTNLNLEVWKVLLGLRDDFLDSKPGQATGA